MPARAVACSRVHVSCFLTHAAWLALNVASMLRLTARPTSAIFPWTRCASTANAKLDLTAPAFLQQPVDASASANIAQTVGFERAAGALPAPAEPVAVQSRYALPGAARPETNKLLPAVLAPPRQDFPAVVDAVCAGASGSTGAPPASPVDWAQALRPQLDELLPQSGVVVVRGIDELAEPAAFSQFVEAMKSSYSCTKFMEGRSMTSTQLTDLVRTGSDDHPAYTIEPHNEYNVVARHRPRKLFLACAEEPLRGCGGEWVITDGSALLRALPEALLKQFVEKGVRYELYYPSEGDGVYNSWQGNIAPSRAEAEAFLQRNGCQWSWNEDDGSLFIHRVMPAMALHPNSGEPCWFNQIHAHHRTFYQDCHPDFEGADEAGPWPVHTKFGDGTEIHDDDIARIREAVWATSVAVPLQRGMVMVVDNYLALHGRMGYEPGSPRQTMVGIIYE